MNIHKIHKKKVFKDTVPFNPHTYWIMLLCGGLLILTAELLFFSWYFMKTTKTLDEQPLPVLETNSAEINRMKEQLEVIKKAVSERIGPTESTSQNDPQVIE